MVNRLKMGFAKHEQCLMTYRGLQPVYGTTQIFRYKMVSMISEAEGRATCCINSADVR